MRTCEEFAAAAASLVGVRYRPCGRSVAVGLDCSGMVKVAAAAIGIVLPDVRFYDPYMPDPSVLLRMCQENLIETDATDQGAGRVGLCRWQDDPEPRHLVVMLGGREITHVDASYRRVTKVPASWLDGKLLRTFRLPGVLYGPPW